MCHLFTEGAQNYRLSNVDWDLMALLGETEEELIRGFDEALPTSAFRFEPSHCELEVIIM